MDDGYLSDNQKKVREDFLSTRKAAGLRHLFTLIYKTIDLRPYGGITQKLRTSSIAKQVLQEIPLNDICGNVNRYSEYYKSFLPLMNGDHERWIGAIREMNIAGWHGLPPVILYQLGEQYYIKDGFQRISIARRLHKKTIRAFVIEICSNTKSGTANSQLDELIINKEYETFLEHTKLRSYFPDADIQITFPGLFPTLEEHIKVHRYYLGIDALKEIEYEEAIKHWYKKIYQPIRDHILELSILHEYPLRTETDLYIWICDHQSELQNEVKWLNKNKQSVFFQPDEFKPNMKRFLYRIGSSMIDLAFPVDAAVRFGGLKRSEKNTENHLINSILVPIDGTVNGWLGLEQALVIAGREGSKLLGLHVIGKQGKVDAKSSAALEKKFKRYCSDQSVEGNFLNLKGDTAKLISKKASSSDLILLNLDCPEPDSNMPRLMPGSLDIIRHSWRCVLATTCRATPLIRILLAYVDSHSCREALFLSTFFAIRWGAMLGVVSVCSSPDIAHQLQAPVRAYLKKRQISASYFQPTGYISDGILKTASEFNADLIMIGGFNRPPAVEVVLDMTLDQLLQKTTLPVLICQ